MNKKIFAMSFVFLLLLSSSVFALGVTAPVPKNMELLRGETSVFEFEIQAVTSTDDMSCAYSIDNMSPLSVTFASNEVVVRAGTIEKVYGTVAVPADAPYNSYSGEIIVSCGAVLTTEGGSDVRTSIGGSMLNVNVVEFREEIKKTATVSQTMSTELLLLIILIIIIVGAYYLKKKKTKKTKRAPAKRKPARKRKK